MNTTHHIKNILLIMFTFILFDAPMILYLYKKFYGDIFTTINREEKVSNIRLYTFSLLFYLLISIGLYTLVIIPAKSIKVTS